MKKTLKITKKIVNVLCWIVIATMAIIIAVSLMSRLNGNAPSFFGYYVYRVSSGSMRPMLEVGDVILDKKIENPYELKVGDVITYVGSGQTENMTVTHQIVKAPHKNDNGEVVLLTKGIANNTSDNEISIDSVKAKYVKKLSIFTELYKIFFTPFGLLIFIALIVLIFLDEIIRLIKNILHSGKEDEPQEDINDIIERVQKESKKSIQENTSDNEKDKRK